VEKIVYLPNVYLPADSVKPSPAGSFSREQLGLPKDGFVFCCFNSVYKITPGTFDSWMRILNEIEGSVLWLAQANPIATRNLRSEALRRGVASERLIFANRMESLADHRARLGYADLFLDTFPYTAHATARDALWVGLPIVTRMGDAFAGRVSASLLTEIGLPELIAYTTEGYEELAMELAANPHRLSDVRAKIVGNRAISALFDVRTFTAQLERAYSTIFQRHLLGQQPEHIHVEP
jgi:predicted O-linked N-acetylglucosamine transferase (SPINDLY family)